MSQNEQGEIKRWVVLTQEILGAKDINNSDKIVLAHISGYEQFFASNETTAEFLGMTARSVQGIKQKLVRLGYIRVLKDTGRGRIYQFNVSRLSKYCQSDSQNFVNQTAEILSPYNKSIYKDKVFIREENSAPVEKSKKEYGRADINELVDLWEKETGITIKGQQNQRRQLYNLTRKYGLDATKALIRRVGVAVHSPDRFAPQIATPSDLTGKYSKLAKLEMWETRNKITRPFGQGNTSPAPAMAVANLKNGVPEYNGAWDEQTDEERDRVSEMIKQARNKLNF